MADGCFNELTTKPNQFLTKFGPTVGLSRSTGICFPTALPALAHVEVDGRLRRTSRLLVICAE
jgi:hypothetical protein